MSWSCKLLSSFKFKQIWPDQGDWNQCEILKGSWCSRFKQIWPDQGDWNDTYGFKSCWDLDIEFKQIWPDQGDWNSSALEKLFCFSPLFKQIWPDQGDWNLGICDLDLCEFTFKQIWPDQGDWNFYGYIVVATTLWHLNKFDPIKGIETPLGTLMYTCSMSDLNKFDPIKGIETFVFLFVVFQPL